MRSELRKMNSGKSREREREREAVRSVAVEVMRELTLWEREKENTRTVVCTNILSP
jgi:hypothetical protein